MTSSSKPILISLNPDRIKLDQGFCYVYDLPVDSPWGDDEHNPYSSTAVLFENGGALGPTHAPHDIIRTQGGGWFSHWNRQLYFSTSDNTPPDLNGRHYYLYVPVEIGSDPEWSFIEHVVAAPQDSKPVLISLNRDRIRPDQGFCYVYDLPVDSPSGDDEHNPYSSTAVLFENGGALGPTHVPHDIIRTQGGGWFSHWNRQLFFSTSDNTPPDLNGRHYYLYVPADVRSDPEWSLINHVKTEPQDVSPQERFDVARRAFRRIWGKIVLPDHGRRIDHDVEFAREFGRLSPASDVTAERKFNLDQLFRLVYSVVGDVAECGTYRGASAFFLARHIQRARLNKKLLLFDSFQGLSKPEAIDESYWKDGDLASHCDDVWSALAPLGPCPFVELFKGWIPERFAEVADRSFSFVHIDVDLYRPTLDSIAFFYPLMSRRGMILLDDYGFASCPGVTQAVDEFMADKPEPIINLASGGAFIVREEK